MKRKLWRPLAALLLLLTMGLSSCYVGYYSGPGYRRGHYHPHPRPHYYQHYHHYHGGW